MKKKKLKDITLSEALRYCINRGADSWVCRECPFYELRGCFGENFADLEEEIEIPEEKENE